jgi:hypothetical protein
MPRLAASLTKFESVASRRSITGWRRCGRSVRSLRAGQLGNLVDVEIERDDFVAERAGEQAESREPVLARATAAGLSFNHSHSCARPSVESERSDRAHVRPRDPRPAASCPPAVARSGRRDG